jgi:hypothetical protein
MCIAEATRSVACGVQRSLGLPDLNHHPSHRPAPPSHRCVPRCNFETLRAHVARFKACPISGCEARFHRTHDVVRDNWLTDLLQSVPASRSTVWIRGSEVTTARPNGGAAAVILVDD